MPLVDEVTQPHLRGRCRPRDILEAYLNRIRQLPRYTNGAAFITDQPIPILAPLGRFCVTVSLGAMNFGSMDQGPETLTCYGQVLVGLFQQNLQEKPGRDNATILNPTDGLLVRMQELLEALVVADPSKGKYSQTWEPAGPTGIPLLRNIPNISAITQPSDVPKFEGWLGVQFSFAIEFDWDLF